jgi:MOSC domain-containing protein YiiM
MTFESRLDWIRHSPRDHGRLELVVRRPRVNEREVLADGTLDPVHGLIGDNWSVRDSTSRPDRAPDPLRQLTLMNARAVEAVAGAKERWPLAGDQLFVDLDLSAANLPPGTRLRIGGAVVDVTSPPHRGCRKFTSRFGADATAFVNSPEGIELNLRGVNARVVQAGVVRVGDAITKVAAPTAAQPAAGAAAG